MLRRNWTTLAGIAAVATAMLAVLIWAFFLRPRADQHAAAKPPMNKAAAQEALAKSPPPNLTNMPFAMPMPPSETSYAAPSGKRVPGFHPVFGFEDPHALSAYFEKDSNVDTAPSLACDKAGDWVAVWTSAPQGLPPVIYVANTIDDGHTWATPKPLSHKPAAGAKPGPAASAPRVAANAAGEWIAVWASNEALDGSGKTDDDIHFSVSTNSGGTWSAPAALNTNASDDVGKDANPKIAADGQNGWIVVWESMDTLGGTLGDDRDLLFARSTDGGATWSAPKPLNTNAATDGKAADRNVAIAADSHGTWIAIWERIDTVNPADSDVDLYTARSLDGGATWSAPARLNSNGGDDKEMDISPSLATDHQGNWVVVWSSKNVIAGGLGPDSDLQFARSTDDGAAWSPPAALHESMGRDGGPDYNPQLSCNGTDWLVVWESIQGGPKGTGGDSDLWVSRSTSQGQAWTEPAPFNTNAGNDRQGDYSPTLANNGSTRWIALWNTTENIEGKTGGDADIIMSMSSNLDARP